MRKPEEGDFIKIPSWSGEKSWNWTHTEEDGSYSEERHTYTGGDSYEILGITGGDISVVRHLKTGRKINAHVDNWVYLFPQPE